MSEPQQVTVTVDREACAVLVAALDLYQRVAMGQWREIVGAAPNVTGEPGYSAGFNDLGDALMAVRCAHTVDPHLRHPNASLAIRESGRTAQVAHDVWHALGGGMRDRRSDRLTDAAINVTTSDEPTGTQENDHGC